jgi:hypothetical protein
MGCALSTSGYGLCFEHLGLSVVVRLDRLGLGALGWAPRGALSTGVGSGVALGGSGAVCPGGDGVVARREVSYPGGSVCGMVTVDDVRRVARSLPRSEEHLIRDRVKFRVGKIVYVAFSRDELVMGFGFPKDEREALVASQPTVFHLPNASNMRFQWAQAWMSELDEPQMEELVIDAWRMCVPKKISAAYVAGLADR